jgi:hypothetical protein
MADDPDTIMAKSDEELVFYTLSGDENSYSHVIGSTAAYLRVAFRMVEASQQQAQAAQAALESAQEQATSSERMLSAARETAEANKALAKYTKNLAMSTWAVALITLVTQFTIIVMALRK